MSDLEKESIHVLTPLIKGHHCVLNDEQQLIVAVWLTLRAMVYEQASDKRYRYYTVKDRVRFAQFLSPPSGTFIWLACYRGDPSNRTRFRLANLTLNRRSAPSYQAQLMTGLIGQFVFQTLVARWPRRRDLEFNSSPVRDWLPATVQLWPFVSDKLTWPPPTHLGDIALEPFMNRWDNGGLSLSPTKLPKSRPRR
jgi:hypothetical protein